MNTSVAKERFVKGSQHSTYSKRDTGCNVNIPHIAGEIVDEMQAFHTQIQCMLGLQFHLIIPHSSGRERIRYIRAENGGDFFISKAFFFHRLHNSFSWEE